MASPLEVFIARKLEARFASLHDAFLSIDTEGNGSISCDGMKTSLKNIFGMEVTDSQMKALFARFAHLDDEDCEKGCNEIRYGDFILNFYNAARDSSRSTASDFSGVDIRIEDEIHLRSALPTLDIIKPPSDTVPKDLLAALQRKILSRSSHGSGTRETRLFLDMDTDRSGKVSPKEFQSWTAKMGLELTDRQCELILGDYYDPNGIQLQKFIQFIDTLENNDRKTLMPWEHQDEDEIRRRRLTARFVAERTTQALQTALKQCTDDAKTDQEIIRIFSSQLFEKRTSLIKEFQLVDKDKSGKLNAKELQTALSSVLDVSVERAQSLIKKFDRDGDGKLNKSEFIFCISSGSVVSTPEKNSSVKSTTGSIPQSQSSPDSLKYTENNDRQMLLEIVSPSKSISTNETATQYHLKDTVMKLDDFDIDVIMKFRKALDDETITMRKFFQKLDKDNSKSLTKDELKSGFEELGVEVSEEHLSHIMHRFDTDKIGSIKFFQFIKLLSTNLME